jgi:hypothetical protein
VGLAVSRLQRQTVLSDIRQNPAKDQINRKASQRNDAFEVRVKNSKQQTPRAIEGDQRVTKSFWHQLVII